jgi:hypothetical protein
MAVPTDRNEHVFIVHVWTEPEEHGSGSRRGYVEHIASRERRYFSHFDEALAFVDALARSDRAV